MTLAMDSLASAAVASPSRGVAWLIAMDFASGMQRITTWPLDVVVGGHVFLGRGALVEVGNVSESENTSSEKMTISVPVVNSAMLANAMGNIEGYRGRRVFLALQLFDSAFRPVGAPVPRWAGYMNPVEVTRSPSPKDGGPSSGRIVVPCTRAGMARARNYDGRRLTHAQQQAEYPGDLALDGLQMLIERPALWVSKRFQEQ